MQNRTGARALLLTLALLMFLLPPAPAAEPMAGQKFPNALAAADQTGNFRTLGSLMGPKGLAVFFVRSADWCPFCKGQLVDANRHLNDFATLGVNVVSVSVDDVGAIAAFAAEQQIGYPMLADPKGLINQALEIRDAQYPLGTKAYGVPKPTLYILDSQGVIRLRYREPTYRTRPALDRVLADVSTLGLK